MEGGEVEQASQGEFATAEKGPARRGPRNRCGPKRLARRARTTPCAAASSSSSRQQPAARIPLAAGSPGGRAKRRRRRRTGAKVDGPGV